MLFSAHLDKMMIMRYDIDADSQEPLEGSDNDEAESCSLKTKQCKRKQFVFKPDVSQTEMFETNIGCTSEKMKLWL